MADPTPDDAVFHTQGIMESPPSARRKGLIGSLDLQPADIADPTPDHTAAAPTQGIMDPPSSKQRKGRLGFLGLPPEIRNRVYGHLFSNNTIHFDGTKANPRNELTLCIDLCTAPLEDHANKREEEAAKPVQGGIHLGRRPVQSEEDKRRDSREVCDSNRMFVSQNNCHQTVQLSTQCLRTCRQVQLDAALLPYSANTFNFSGALPDVFCDAFVQKFSFKQRHAFQTAIVDTMSLKFVQKIPDLLPDLRHLWLKSWSGFWRRDLEEYYARVKLRVLSAWRFRWASAWTVIAKTWSWRFWTTKTVGVSRSTSVLGGQNGSLAREQLGILGECSLLSRPKKEDGPESV